MHIALWYIKEDRKVSETDRIKSHSTTVINAEKYGVFNGESFRTTSHRFGIREESFKLAIVDRIYGVVASKDDMIQAEDTCPGNI